MSIRAVLVCVDYDDLLRQTLPHTLRHVDHVVVVTSPQDVKTQQLVAEYPERVQLHVTSAFYENGAAFNKGKALEEGFDVLGRKGWLLVMDADIVLPAVMPTVFPRGRLYTPHRRVHEQYVVDAGIPPEASWEQYPRKKENGNYGYFQLFHSADPVLASRPWYDTTWRHAGGCDSVFQRRWSPANRVRLPFDVLHLGPTDANWFGRATPRADDQYVPGDAEQRRDLQEKLHRKYGWKGRPKTGEAVQERIDGGTDIEPAQLVTPPTPKWKYQRIRKKSP